MREYIRKFVVVLARAKAHNAYIEGRRARAAARHFDLSRDAYNLDRAEDAAHKHELSLAMWESIARRFAC